MYPRIIQNKTHYLMLLMFHIFFLMPVNPCRSQTDNIRTTHEIQQLLIARKWILSQHVVEQGGTTIMNYLTRIPDCQRDDQMIFRSNGTYRVLPGEKSCTESDAGSGHGSWRIDSDGRLNMEYLGGKPLVREVQNIGYDQLVLIQKNENGSTTKWIYHTSDEPAIAEQEDKKPLKAIENNERESKPSTYTVRGGRPLEETPELLAKKNKPRSFASKWLAFNIYAAGGYRTMRVDEGHYAYSYRPDYGPLFRDTVCTDKSSGGLAYNLGIEWEHFNFIYLQLGFNGVTGDVNAQGLHTGAGLLLDADWVKLKPGIMITWQYARIHLHDLESDPYQHMVIDGNTFIDEKVDVALLERTWGFQPQISVDIKLFGNWGLRSNIGLYIPVSRNSQWEFSGTIGSNRNPETGKWDEKDGKVYQDLRNGNVLNFRFNDKAAEHLGVQLLGAHAQLGVYYSFAKD